MEGRVWDREWESHAAFYQDVYANSINSLREAGTTGASLLRAEQAPGDWSDAPTPDLVVTVLTSAAIGLDADQGAGRFREAMDRGHFIVTPPGAGSTIMVDKDHRLMCLAVPYARLLALAGPEAGLPGDGDFGALHRSIQTDNQVPALLERVWRETAPGSPAGNLWADGAMLQLAARMLVLKDRSAARRRHRGGLAPWQARRVADYIEANLAEDLTLAELATLAGLSSNHFCTAFGESFGQPPAAWLQARRIARAQAMMLDQPDLCLSAIALAVGYASQSAFGSAFRKLVGTSPGRWRQVMRA